VHRPIGRRGGMVCPWIYTMTPCKMSDNVQGYIHHRLLDPRRRRQSTPNTNEELDLHHLLRGCSHLRSHHGHRLLVEVEERLRGRHTFANQLLHRLRVVLVWADGGDVQFDMWCLCGYQWKQCCSGRCGRPVIVRWPQSR